MQFQEAIDFLTGRINYERSSDLPYRSRCFKLRRMEDLLELVGSPHREIRAVHITGTKGKGSCVAMVSSILRKANFKVGCFTSPHLESVRERLVINGTICPEERFAQLVERLIPAVGTVDKLAENRGYIHGPTYFEILTAAAFLYFAEENVDLAILEVGLGGRLDATNVCQPLVAVITNVSLDHTEQLGSTLESICREKAGIIKPGVRTVSGVVDSGPRKVVKEVASRVGSPVWELGRDFHYRYYGAEKSRSERISACRFTTRFDYRFSAGEPRGGKQSDPFGWRTQEEGHYSLDHLEVPLLGEHQAANAAVALSVILQLRKLGWKIDDAAIRDGLAGTYWPGRIEIVCLAPSVVLDGAHNAASMAALLRTLREYFPDRRLLVLFGTNRDKDVVGMLRLLIPVITLLVLTQCTDNPRAIPADELLAIARHVGAAEDRLVAIPDPLAAWQVLRSQADGHDLLCVTGSLFLVGQLRRHIYQELRGTVPTT